MSSNETNGSEDEFLIDPRFFITMPEPDEFNDLDFGVPNEGLEKNEKEKEKNSEKEISEKNKTLFLNIPKVSSNIKIEEEKLLKKKEEISSSGTIKLLQKKRKKSNK